MPQPDRAVSHHGGAFEQICNSGGVSTFKSNLCETVLHDLYGRARLGHLVTQVEDLVRSQAFVVGHNDHACGFGHFVERRDELFFLSSFHVLFSILVVRVAPSTGLTCWKLMLSNAS